MLDNPILPRPLWQLEQGINEGPAVFGCTGGLTYLESYS